MISAEQRNRGFQPQAVRRLKRTDWSGYEFTPAMIDAARKNFRNQSTLWTALRESGYLDGAIAYGGGEIA